MPADDDSSRPEKNPFVRFKQNVDARFNASASRIVDHFFPQHVASLSSRDGSESNSNSNSNRNSYENNSNSDKNDNNHDNRNRSTMSSCRFPFSPPDTPIRAWDAETAAWGEARLEQLSGGSVAEHEAAWRLFAAHSPYSPLVLDREGVPPPHRRNQHPDSDAARDDFFFSNAAPSASWADAFEDLLRASSGARPLGPDGKPTDWPLSSPFGRMFWARRTTSPVFWVRALTAQGLDEVYFPIDDPMAGVRSPRTMQEWIEWRRQPRHWGPWANSSRPFGRRCGSRGGSVAGEEEEEQRKKAGKAKNKDSKPAAAIESAPETETPWWEKAALEAFGKQGEQSNDRDSNAVSRQHDKSVAEPKHQQVQEQQQPRTELDVFEAARSVIPEVESSLGTLLRSFGLEPPDLKADWNLRTGVSREQYDKRTSSETVRDASGGKVVRTTEEFVDEHGDVHVRTEVRTTDASGREVSRQTQYEVRSKASRQEAQSGWGDDRKREDDDYMRKAGSREEEVGGQGKGQERPADDDEKKWTKKDADKGKGNGGWFW